MEKEFCTVQTGDKVKCYERGIAYKKIAEEFQEEIDTIINKLSANDPDFKAKATIIGNWNSVLTDRENKDFLAIKGVIDKVLSGIDYDIMQTHPIDFKCNCSRQRYARALMGLGKKELERFIEEKENVECECSFCGSKYSFDINQLQEMISTINDIKK